jgi:NAD(P)H-hydrate repair Nnr-like enzyme with NAD(P)H-hydrate epimerase domain
MSLAPRRGGLAVLALAAVLIAAGCGGVELDASKTQDQLKAYIENLEKTKVSSVDCPSGVEVKAGNTLECSVSLQDGKKGTVTVKILNSDADTAVTDLRFNK